MESQATLGKLTMFEAVVNENPQDIPVPPKELTDYRNSTKEERDSMAERFFKQQFIQDYLELKWKAELHNRDCFLNMWNHYQTEKDPAKRSALENKMRMFKYKISNNSHPFRALTLNLLEYPIGNSKEQPAWNE